MTVEIIIGIITPIGILIFAWHELKKKNKKK